MRSGWLILVVATSLGGLIGALLGVASKTGAAGAGLGVLGGFVLGAGAWHARRAGLAVRAVAFGALGGVAGLWQAESAPFAYVAEVALGLTPGEARPAEGPSPRRRVEGWVAYEVRNARLPIGVRFEAHERASGRLELNARGAERARVHRVLTAALDNVQARHEGTTLLVGPRVRPFDPSARRAPYLLSGVGVGLLLARVRRRRAPEAA